eukprot:jgi/Tetstr1/447353/TSEL_034790.t1
MVISQTQAVSREVKAQACRVSVRDVHAQEVAAMCRVMEDLAAEGHGHQAGHPQPQPQPQPQPPTVSRPLPVLPDDVVGSILDSVAKTATRQEIPNVRLVNKYLAGTVTRVSPRWPVQPLVRVGPSAVHGQGVFSCRAFATNDVIGRHKGTILVGRRFPSDMVTNPLTFQFKGYLDIAGEKVWRVMVPPAEQPPPLIQPFDFVNHACCKHANCIYMEVTSTHALNTKVVVTGDSLASASQAMRRDVMHTVAKTSVYVFCAAPIAEGEELLTNYAWYRSVRKVNCVLVVGVVTVVHENRRLDAFRTTRLRLRSAPGWGGAVALGPESMFAGALG